MPEAATSFPAFERLWPLGDRELIDRDLVDFLADSQQRFGGNALLTPFAERLDEFVLRGGKRLRPRLCLAAYRILSGRDEPPRPVRLAAASLELFHAFMLVHDDLIDGSLVRRDEPTLHETLREDYPGPDAPHRGMALGIIGGDLLCALGMRLISRAGLDEVSCGRAVRLISEMLLETGIGEALDVLYGERPLDGLTEEQIVSAYLCKTARYTVSGPLVLGATLAGATPAVCRALNDFGDRLGLGYQVGNDLDALEANLDEGDHADLDGGKRTLVLWKAYQRLAEPGRRALVAALAEPPGPDRRRRLLALIHASGAPDVCRILRDQTRDDAAAALRHAPLDLDQRRAFFSLIPLFSRATAKAPTACVATDCSAVASALDA